MKWLGLMMGFLCCGNIVLGQSAVMTKTWFSLGDDSVGIVTYLKPGKSQAFIHVHENETTSLEAGLNILEHYGGKLITLQHSQGIEKQRYITFHYQKNQYKIDPNRIFTHDSAVLNSNIQLVKGSGPIPTEVQAIVKKLADYVWEQIRGYELIVALHNNKNEPASYKRKWLFWTKFEPDSYSILSYAKAFDKSSESNLSCASIFINPNFNNSEFFIVTEQRDFDMLAMHACSVVLQNHQPIDDGSLSVYALKNKRRYINTEAKHGRFNEQVDMLEVLMRAVYNY